MTKLSIILPIYNVEEYLREAIESIITQSFTDIEVLLINDGSIDNSPAICDEFALIDDRIKVFHQMNSGVSAARNLGLDKAQGEYVTFLDPDDYLLSKEMYTTIFSAIDNDIDFVHFGYYIDEFSITYQPKILGRINKDTFLDKVFSDFVGKKTDHFYDTITSLATVWSIIIRRDIIGETRFENIKLTEDKIFFFDLVFQAKNFFLFDNVFYFYRKNNKSATRKYLPNRSVFLQQSNNHIKKLLDKNNRYKQYKEEFDNSVIRSYYGCILNEAYSPEKSESIKLLKRYATDQNINKLLTFQKTFNLMKTKPFWIFIKFKQFRLFYFILEYYRKIKKI